MLTHNKNQKMEFKNESNKKPLKRSGVLIFKKDVSLN